MYADAEHPAVLRPVTAERGQSIPIVALVLWLVAALLVATATVGAVVVDRARAQAGADATALAAAVDPEAAPAVATANGAVIVRQTRQGVDVRIDVRSGRAVAAAQAAVDRPEWQGLRVELRAALARAERLLGGPIPIVSGFRTRADQQRLWDTRHHNPHPVAPPGTSAHELGLAIDVPLDTAGRLAPLASLTGLCQPLPTVDPVHFVLCRTTPTR